MPRNDTAPSHTTAPAGVVKCQFCGLYPAECRMAQKLKTSSRGPNQQTIKERAEFLGHEIYNDAMANEQEIANAIEAEIRRFLS